MVADRPYRYQVILVVLHAWADSSSKNDSLAHSSAPYVPLTEKRAPNARYMDSQKPGVELHERHLTSCTLDNVRAIPLQRMDILVTDCTQA